MGLLMFFGCLFLALSPPLAIFFLVISKSPRLIILMIGSSFFWLISILLASIWWYIIPPLREVFYWTIPWSVLFQEAVRFGFFFLYNKAQKGFEVRDRSQQTAHLTTHPDHLKASLALGLGAGVTHSFILYIPILWHGSGPAAAFSKSCPSTNLFLTSALLSACWILLHTFWSVIAFDGFRNRSWSKMIGVVVSHLVASLLTLLNLPGGSCWAAVTLLMFFTGATGIVTWLVVLRSQNVNSRVTTFR